MSLCCFRCCDKKDKTDKQANRFPELSQFLVDYAIKKKLYTRPRCPFPRLAYEVQWHYLTNHTELQEFRILPRDGDTSAALNSAVLGRSREGTVKKAEQTGRGEGGQRFQEGTNGEETEGENTERNEGGNTGGRREAETVVKIEGNDAATTLVQLHAKAVKPRASIETDEDQGAVGGADIGTGEESMELLPEAGQTSAVTPPPQTVSRSDKGTGEESMELLPEAGQTSAVTPPPQTVSRSDKGTGEKSMELLPEAGRTSAVTPPPQTVSRSDMGTGEKTSDDQTNRQHPSTEKAEGAISKLYQAVNRLRGKSTKDKGTARKDDVRTKAATDDHKQDSGQIQIYRAATKESNKSRIKHKPKPRALSLFKTEYTNTTDAAQKFTFHTERKTTSSVSVRLQKSFTLGGKLNVSLTLPTVATPDIDPLGVSGALTGQVQITRDETETHATDQMWSVNNEVEVGQGKRVIAEMKVIEEEASAQFKLKHTLCMKPTAKHIPIYVLNQSEMKKTPERRHVRKMFMIGSQNLHRAFNTEAAREKNIRACEDSNSVEFDSEGALDCVYQCKQVIDVTQEDLNGEIPANHITQ